jgi:hypothetical protein
VVFLQKGVGRTGEIVKTTLGIQETIHIHRVVGGRTTIGMGLRRPDAGSGELGRDDKRSRGSRVLTLLERSGGAEAGLGRGTLGEPLDLELRRGGERRLWS